MVEIILENIKQCLTIYKGLSLMIIMYETMRERKKKNKAKQNCGVYGNVIETHIREMFQKFPKGRRNSNEALH